MRLARKAPTENVGIRERVKQFADASVPHIDAREVGAVCRDGMGSDYRGGTTLYKPWPAVGVSHSHIHATIELMKLHDLNVADIAEIRVYVGDYHRLMSEPLEARRAPATLMDARFSLPFLVAVAAVRREMGISDFTAARLKNPDVLATAQKVVSVADDALDWRLKLPDGRVEMIMRDGRTYSRVGENVPGTPESPLSWDDIARKFADCASAAATPPSAERIAMVQRLAGDLETLDDATELLRALV